MINAIASLLGVIGVDITPPQTVGEFFPYFFTCLLAFCMVAGVFQLLRWCCATLIRGSQH